jgi:Zn-dependent peptidase ImmA (M78 family)
MGFSLTEPVEMRNAYRIGRITCAKRPLESDLSGIFVRANNAEVVLINSAKSLGHQNFTMAHELYHALLDKGLETRNCEPGVNGSFAERAADEFASHFLLPIEGIEYLLHRRGRVDGALELRDVIYIEQIFGVSHKATLVQLAKVRLITAEMADAWMPNVIQAARRLGYSDELYRPTREEVLWSDYAERAAQALEAGQISFGKYEELLSDAGLHLPGGVEDDGDVAD